MAEAIYEIVGSGSVWVYEHGGEESPAYASAEAAFEAAVNAAAVALRDGLDLTIRLSRAANPGDCLSAVSVEEIAPEARPAMRALVDAPG